VCEVSNKVSYDIARCGEAHTIAKNLIVPCAEDISCELSDNHLNVINAGTRFQIPQFR